MTAPNPSALILFRREGRPPKPGETFIDGRDGCLSQRDDDTTQEFDYAYKDDCALAQIPAAEALERQVDAVVRMMNEPDIGSKITIRARLTAALLGPAPDEPPEWARECAETWNREFDGGDIAYTTNLARHIARYAPGGES